LAVLQFQLTCTQVIANSFNFSRVVIVMDSPSF
jgi:hypothetical protein